MAPRPEHRSKPRPRHAPKSERHAAESTRRVSRSSRPDRTPGRRAALVEALLLPEPYPHPVDQPVRLVETHISHLFLTGKVVYKVKKPVDLGFLDFSTLEERRRFTYRELRLNRALSPSVYLGVSVVRRDRGGRFTMAENGRGRSPVAAGEQGGEVEEYALKMRQLDREGALSARVTSGKAAARELEALGTYLAGFHSRAARAGRTSPYGGPALVRKLVTDNLAAIGPWTEALSIGDSVSRTAAYTRGAIDALRPMIAERKADGWVRDCHGDLHADNIFLEGPGRAGGDGPTVQIIDRIEFNDRYRYIDVASDLAFLTMDLRRLGHPELADALLSAYRSGTDSGSRDDSGSRSGLEQMLRFYEVYRAMVRCKVAVLRVAGQVRGRPRRLHLEPAEAGTAREYAELAARLVAAQRPRALFLMTGMTGSGKSTVARELAARWNMRHVSSDVVRKTLFGLDPHRPSDPALREELYSPRMSGLTYRELERLGAEALGRGRSVVLDATFLKRDYRKRAGDIAARQGVPVVVVECRIDRRKALGRLRKRYLSGESESDAGPELLDYHLAEWQAVNASECDAHIVIDTSGDPGRYIDEAEAEVWRRLLRLSIEAPLYDGKSGEARGPGRA